MSPTATCFCGAVQLAFSLEGDNFIGAVSRLILSAVRSHIPQVRLPLHRRPQNHILHVRLEFHHQGRGLNARPRARQTHPVHDAQDSRERRLDDQSLLQRLRELDVPDFLGLSRESDSEDWAGG